MSTQNNFPAAGVGAEGVYYSSDDFVHVKTLVADLIRSDFQIWFYQSTKWARPCTSRDFIHVCWSSVTESYNNCVKLKSVTELKKVQRIVRQKSTDCLRMSAKTSVSHVHRNVSKFTIMYACDMKCFLVSYWDISCGVTTYKQAHFGLPLCTWPCTCTFLLP